MPDSILDDTWLQTSMTEFNKRRFVIAEGDSSKVKKISRPTRTHQTKSTNLKKKIIFFV